ARARAADHAENLAALDLEVETFVHDRFAETVLQPLDDDGMLAGIVLDRLVERFLGDFGRDRLCAHAQPISVKNAAKKASSTMTMKIAWTTAIVVLAPTSSELPLTCMPW